MEQKNCKNGLDGRIKELCRERGITLAKLAESINVPPSSLSQIMKGNPTLSKMQDISIALGVDIVELFAEKGDFVAFVRRQGETFTFDSEKALIDYAEGLKVNK